MIPQRRRLLVILQNVGQRCIEKYVDHKELNYRIVNTYVKGNQSLFEKCKAGLVYPKPIYLLLMFYVVQSFNGYSLNGNIKGMMFSLWKSLTPPHSENKYFQVFLLRCKISGK